MAFLKTVPHQESTGWLYGLVTGCCGLVFKFIYRNKIFFTENPPSGAALLAANHTSFFDPPLIGGSWPQEIHFLASDYLFKVPLLGPFINALNSHPVARGRGDIAAFRTVLNLLKGGKKVVLFPEGTRSKNGELMEFKRGVAKLSMGAHAPIIPVYIEGTGAIWGPDRKWPRLGGRTRIFYGKAIYPSDYQDLPRREAEEEIVRDLRASILLLKEQSLTIHKLG